MWNGLCKITITLCAREAGKPVRDSEYLPAKGCTVMYTLVPASGCRLELMAASRNFFSASRDPPCNSSGDRIIHAHWASKRQ